jgi:hypothetical protein
MRKRYIVFKMTGPIIDIELSRDLKWWSNVEHTFTSILSTLLPITPGMSLRERGSIMHSPFKKKDEFDGIFSAEHNLRLISCTVSPFFTISSNNSPEGSVKVILMSWWMFDSLKYDAKGIWPSPFVWLPLAEAKARDNEILLLMLMIDEGYAQGSLYGFQSGLMLAGKPLQNKLSTRRIYAGSGDKWVRVKVGTQSKPKTQRKKGKKASNTECADRTHNKIIIMASVHVYEDQEWVQESPVDMLGR